MPYTKAADVLPPCLIREIQVYIQGAQIYIPRTPNEKLGWGMKNGTRNLLHNRNLQIKDRKAEGWTIEELADEYHLSLDTIRKILYVRR